MHDTLFISDSLMYSHADCDVVKVRTIINEHSGNPNIMKPKNKTHEPTLSHNTFLYFQNYRKQ